MAERTNNGSEWLNVFANFRGGTVLTEIIKEEEPFIREPYWLSPLHGEGYRLYHTFEIDGITRSDEFPIAGDGPLWDGVCKDDISRKYLFLRAVDTPEALKGDCSDISEEEKACMKQVFRMLNLDGDIESWYHEYYPVARELTYVTLLSDPMGKNMGRGFRAELVILSLVDNYLGEKTAAETWEAFFKEMIDRMFGPRGIPYVVFTVLFSV